MTEEPNAPRSGESVSRALAGWVGARYPALRIPAFRWLLLALTLGELGVFAVELAIIWVILEETGSAALVGVAIALMSGSFLISVLPVGLAADRSGPRRSLLLGTLAASVVYALAGILTLIEANASLVAFGVAAASGVAAAMQWIPGQLMAARIVGRSAVTSAIGLRFLPIGVAWILGGVIAGVTLELVGAMATFLVIAAVLFAAALVVLKLPRLPGLETAELHALGESRLAIRAIVRSPVVLGLATLAAILGLFVMTRITIYPVLIRDVLGAGPWLLGSFVAAHGLGAIVGALTADPLGRAVGAGPAAILTLGLCGLSIAMIGVSDVVVLSMLAAAAATTWMIAHLAIGSALVQLATPARMRGRVLAIYDFGRLSLLVFGSLLAGLLVGAAGPSIVLVIFGILTIVAALAVRVVDPELWRLRVDEHGQMEGVTEVADGPVLG